MDDYKEEALQELRKLTKIQEDNIGKKEFRELYNMAFKNMPDKEKFKCNELVGIIVRKMRDIAITEFMYDIVESGIELEIDGIILADVLEAAVKKHEVNDVIAHINAVEKYNFLMPDDKRIKY